VNWREMAREVRRENEKVHQNDCQPLMSIVSKLSEPTALIFPVEGKPTHSILCSHGATQYLQSPQQVSFYCLKDKSCQTVVDSTVAADAKPIGFVESSVFERVVVHG
jgi:hypothetical protein